MGNKIQLHILKKSEQNSCGLLQYKQYVILFITVKDYRGLGEKPLIKCYRTFYNESILGIKNIEKDCFHLSIQSKLITGFSLAVISSRRDRIISEINHLIKLENTFENSPYI